MKLQVILLIIINSVLIPQITSQTTISGQISDDKDGVELPGANILVEGSFQGIHSLPDGSFMLEVDKRPPFNVRFSYVGYKTLVITITEDNEELDIKLSQISFNLNEVAVTAQLREQLIQEVPISVGILTKDMINNSNELNNPGDVIPYVPGFSGKSYSSNGSWFTIRGINTGSFGVGYESSVAVFYDGVYNGRTTTASRGFFDLDRIEVLKGPQNTLFGRNAIAGVVSMHSSKPKFKNESLFEFNIGNWGQFESNVMFNFKPQKNLAIRYAGNFERRRGVRSVTNFENHQMGKKENIANRISLLWRPANTFKMWLKLEHQLSNGGGVAFKNNDPLFGVSPGHFDREIQLDFTPKDDNEYFTIDLHSNWVINDQLAFTSITAYNTNDQEIDADIDASPTSLVRFLNPNSFKNYSQEFRLNGQNENINWMLASSIFIENAEMEVGNIADDNQLVPLALGPLGVPLDFCVNNPACKTDATEINESRADNKSFSLYGTFDIDILKSLNASLGLRLSIDNKKFETFSELGNGAFHLIAGDNLLGPVGFNENEKTWSALQPRIAISYKAGENSMIYGSYTRGYKTGGFNTYTANKFGAESNDAFELGIKSSFADNRVRLNLSSYYMIYKNLQVESRQNVVIEVNNAGKTQSPGLEFESSFAINDKIDIIANAGFNFSEYRDFVIPNPDNPAESLDFSGNIPDRSPRTQLNFIFQYKKSFSDIGNLRARIDYSYQSKEFYSRENLDELSFEGYGLFNASLGIEKLFGGRLDLNIYTSNISNRDYLTYLATFLNISEISIIGPPRLYGVKLRINDFL